MWALWMQSTFDCAPFTPIVRVSFWIDELDVVTGNELKYRHFGSFSHDDGASVQKKVVSADGNKFAETSSWNWKYSNILVNCCYQTCQKKKKPAHMETWKFSSRKRCLLNHVVLILALQVVLWGNTVFILGYVSQSVATGMVHSVLFVHRHDTTHLRSVFIVFLQDSVLQLDSRVIWSCDTFWKHTIWIFRSTWVERHVSKHLGLCKCFLNP